MMKVYVAVAEASGFAAASRKLKISAPAVTRSVAALEESLGVKLLHRTTRLVTPTEAGKRYLIDAKEIIQQVDTVHESIRGVNNNPKGKIAVTAPVMFGQKFVNPVVVDYLNRYPETQVDALYVDRMVNLLEEGIDVAVRIGQLADSNMRALKVGDVRVLTVASPEYLKYRGTPQAPDELKGHNIIATYSSDMSKDWHFVAQQKKVICRIDPRLSVVTNQSAISAATQGFGIARLLSYQVSEQLAKGELQVILESFELPKLPVQIVHREGPLSSTRVRSFIDLLAEHLNNLSEV